jgi:hypothetical protein
VSTYVENVAQRIGVTLGHDLQVNGHHGTVGDHRGGCGSYNLVLNIENERVDCEACGATDLIRLT